MNNIEYRTPEEFEQANPKVIRFMEERGKDGVTIFTHFYFYENKIIGLERYSQLWKVKWKYEYATDEPENYDIEAYVRWESEYYQYVFTLVELSSSVTDG